MSTEWIQIIIVIGIIVPLTILTGRYLVWRKWDKERRINRLARREGLKEAGLRRTLAEFRYQDPEKGRIEMLSDAGHSVKA